jgi:hypothetical protein
MELQRHRHTTTPPKKTHTQEYRKKEIKQEVRQKENVQYCSILVLAIG